MRKKVLRAILILAALYGLWLAYEVVGFKTYRSSIALDPVESRLEVQGVYHIHTRFSDGRSSLEEIAGHAEAAALDFIVVTDHGNPNFASLAAQGRKGGLLVLSGSELNVNRGHLVALGFKTPAKPLSTRAEEAVAEVRALDGFTVIAHPYSKVKWSWGEDAEYSGIEIINADTMLKDNIFRVLPYLPLLVAKSRLPLIRMLEHPGINLKKWDERNAKSPLYGYFSADAHVYYRAMFSLLHLHLLLDEPLAGDFEKAGNQVFGALRKGKFFNAIDAVAEARGFRFEALAQGRTYHQGDAVRPSEDARLEVRAPFSFAKEIVLHSFPHPQHGAVLERMVEVLTITERRLER